MLDHGDDVLLQLDRLRAMQPAQAALEGPFVVRHTDLHVNNVRVDEGGRVALLDWDDAKAAPPEHDLWTGLSADEGGAAFGACVDAYLEAGGAAPLQLERFEFYLLRRYVEDMAVCLADLLAEGADPREDEAQVERMRAWGAERWARLTRPSARHRRRCARGADAPAWSNRPRGGAAALPSAGTAIEAGRAARHRAAALSRVLRCRGNAHVVRGCS